MLQGNRYTHLLPSTQHDLIVEPPHDLPSIWERRVWQEHVICRVRLTAVERRVNHPWWQFCSGSRLSIGNTLCPSPVI